jgi:hypothetical protein
LKTVIMAADPGSLVHDYDRFTSEPASLLALFRPGAANTPLRAWIFRPASIGEFFVTMRRAMVVYTFVLRFVHSLQDATATEKTALDVIETVRGAIRLNETLNGAALSTTPTFGPLKGVKGLQLMKIETLSLGGVFCHYAELELSAQEIVTT